MTPRRRLLLVACFAMLLAIILGMGAGYLFARHAHFEAAGVFLCAIGCVILGAIAVPKADEK